MKKKLKRGLIRTMTIDANKEVYEDEFIRIFLTGSKPKTNVYSVWSKCSDCKLGEIKWYPQWRHYCFFIGGLVFSDRCLLNLGNNVLEANKQHKCRKERRDE